ncbi:MAG TPA: RluA family pseudouridine synthase [Bacteriovoracaceae bacterium]|nr:RluA family pseudouridine synthase [Bacteriovoracaceae bacterium]
MYKALVSKLFPEGVTLGDVLAKLSKLNTTVLEDAASKGAVWVQKGNGKTLRERSLTRKVSPQDTVSFFYDPKVLTLQAVTTAECLFENQRYGIWLKAAGVVPQGTQAGDHASLLRYIETVKKKEVYLVHRLDRETAGLMVFAYTAEAAGKLGDLFQKNLIKKDYEAIVAGEIERGTRNTIDATLDDKKAVTHYEVLGNKNGMSLLTIQIETGRLHQIRRHLDGIGHPVMGDPKYGRGNKNKEGLKLLAKSLSFQDPWEKKTVTWVMRDSLTL